MPSRWRQFTIALLVGGILLALGASQGFALQVGDKAPMFDLQSTTGDHVKLDDYLGKKSVVLFFYIGAFTKGWTQEALAFQLDLPKFEAAGAQVLGVSVDFNDANVAWAEKLGLTYPLLSDLRRQVAKSYDVLFDDSAMANDPKKIAVYLRSKRAFFVIDTEGVIRFAKVVGPRDVQPPTDDLLKVIKDL